MADMPKPPLAVPGAPTPLPATPGGTPPVPGKAPGGKKKASEVAAAAAAAASESMDEILGQMSEQSLKLINIDEKAAAAAMGVDVLRQEVHAAFNDLAQRVAGGAAAGAEDPWHDSMTSRIEDIDAATVRLGKKLSTLFILLIVQLLILGGVIFLLVTAPKPEAPPAAVAPAPEAPKPEPVVPEGEAKTDAAADAKAEEKKDEEKAEEEKAEPEEEPAKKKGGKKKKKKRRR